jgi:hypothetical protein
MLPGLDPGDLIGKAYWAYREIDCSHPFDALGMH